jgi:Zn-dependent metalloprotease
MGPRAAANAPAATTGEVTRETYDAQHQELPDGDLGKLVRKEGDPPTGDAAVDDAHDNAKTVYDFYKQVLGRDSLDDHGMTLKSTVHFGENFNNAYWDGTHMTYGDGDGKEFSNLAGALDVVGHEMTHGVTERTAGLSYDRQSGALNESWSDVMGELIQQWHDDPADFTTTVGAQKASWLVGESVFTPGVAGDGLRSLKDPGHAYKGDPQPGDMKHYKKMSPWDDNGGVHINSGIPNHAAYFAAVKLGGEKTAQVWYTALTQYLRPDSQFTDAANATISAARDLFKDGSAEEQAVTDAWKAVGIAGHAVPKPAQVAPPGPPAPSASRNPGIVPPWLSPVSDAVAAATHGRAARPTLADG